MGWIHILGQHTIFHMYLSHYVLITFLASCKSTHWKAEGHCHICWTPVRHLAPAGTNNLPPGSRLLTLSLPYLSPLSLSDKKIFQHTHLYLPIKQSFNTSNPSSTVSAMSHPITRCFPLHLRPIHQFLTNVYNVTHRSLFRPRCPQNNTGNLFPCKLITVAAFSTFLTDE